jgi:hypothetical protein
VAIAAELRQLMHARSILHIIPAVKEMKQELRSAHFHFGNHETTYESTAKGALVGHQVSSET